MNKRNNFIAKISCSIFIFILASCPLLYLLFELHKKRNIIISHLGRPSLLRFILLYLFFWGFSCVHYNFRALLHWRTDKEEKWVFYDAAKREIFLNVYSCTHLFVFMWIFYETCFFLKKKVKILCIYVSTP